MITDAKPGKITFLGRLGEHLTRKIRFYDGDVLRDYPGAEISVLNQRPGDADSYPVPSAYIEQDGDYLYWTIQSGDLAADGFGQCEMRATVDGKVALSVVYATEIGKSLAGGDEPPEPWEGYVGQVIDAADRAEAAAQLLENPGAEAVTLEPGAQATAGYEDGTFTFGIPAGTPGQDGEPGEDGYSPSVSVSKVGGTATITITDKSGTTTAEITDGQPGEPGSDGYSPSASVSKAGGTATITITDKSGTTSAEITDGQDGEPGEDGYSPSASVSKAGGTATITITDKSGTTTAEIEDGQDGATPQRGVDYWTDADKTEIISAVEAEVEPEISALKSAIDAKAPVILRDASGDIVTISDGADGMPLSSCMVSVDPVQDLHGYDYPWPAGGGKNLIDAQDVTGITSQTVISEYFLIPAGTYTVSAYISNSGSAGAGVRITSQESGDIKTIGYNQTSTVTRYSGQFTLESASHIRAVAVGSASGYNASISKVQVESGSTATDYSPYSNICPISGHTGTTVTRTGINLFDQSQLLQASGWALNNDGYYYGTRSAFNTAFNSGFPINPKLKPNAQYTLSFVGYNSSEASNTYLRLNYTDGTYSYIAFGGTTPTAYTLISTAGKTVAYLSGTFGSQGDIIAYIKDVMLVEGSTASDFVPYQGTTYPITFPDSAGTVYGGTLTVNQDGTGRLVVDANTFDMGDVDWAEYGGNYPNLFYTILTNAILPPNNFTIAQIKSTIYHVERSNNIGNVGYTNGYIGLNNGGRLYVNDVRYSSKQDFVSGVTGQKVWYKLATPITYDLTALEVIETLKGVNNIWADTGAISLTYPADTKTYVDDHTPVQDVQIDGTSILSNGVANVPVATGNNLGVVKTNYMQGVSADSSGSLLISLASDDEIKSGSNGLRRPITPTNQHQSAFYALAKAAGADMASSSNPVGTYTDAAKVAIQKMLGIYQAPWELIREDTVTNATEADIEITVDGNGQAFELTDAIIVLFVPTQEATVTIADYGRIYFRHSGTSMRSAYLTNAYSKTVSPNSSIQVATVKIVNENGLLSVEYAEWAAIASHSYLRITASSVEDDNTTPYGLKTQTIDSIKIGKITGTMNYRLFGRRKWN